MKKIRLFIVILLAGVFIFNIRINYQSSKYELSLLNVEALAGEFDNRSYCVGTGSLDCPDNDSKVQYVFEMR